MATKRKPGVRPVRAWAIEEIDAGIRTIYTSRLTALDLSEPAFGDKIIAGTFTPDPPKPRKGGKRAQ